MDNIATAIFWQEELAKEQKSHDAEINRICQALDLPSESTIEDIVKKIKEIKYRPVARHATETCLDFESEIEYIKELDRKKANE